ncbi:hypothetical protein K7432_000064 [Basidiobolus ranarum]|uniref:Major facilitator superfamily (MFS) profile domain-containing protein n=1 Tax=Basidiobolus ranarum TaxID=34480 RepID=A0ABR2X5A3_9FUNG
MTSLKVKDDSESTTVTPSPATEFTEKADTEVAIDNMEKTIKFDMDPEGLELKYTPRQRIIIFVGLMLAIFLASLDQTIVATALPAISSEFNALNQVSWVATSYLLTFTSFQPLYGKFSDIFGRKATILFALVTFLGGSIMCGVSQNMTMLIIFRAVSGIGGGGIICLVVIIISDIFPLHKRGKYLGVIGAVFALSGVLGPLLGGIFSDHVSWRWAFYINMPIGAITLFVVIFMLKMPVPEGSFREKLYKIDYWGIFTLLGSVICILLATNWGGNDYPWSSPVVISVYCVGFILLIAFVLVELKTSKEPLIAPHLFKIRNVLVSSIGFFMVGASVFGAQYYLPIYFQVVKGYTATGAGLQLLPFMLGVTSTSILSGAVSASRGWYRVFAVPGAVILTVGLGLSSTLNENTSRALLIIYLVLIGVGFGCEIQTLLLAAQASVEVKDIASTTSLVTFLRTIGGVFGVAIQGAVLTNFLGENIKKVLPSTSSETAALSVTAIQQLDPEIRKGVIGAYVNALNKSFLSVIPFGILAVIVLLFLRKIPAIRKKQSDNVIAASGH